MDSVAELKNKVELGQIYKMDGDNHILLNTTLDKLENYKHFNNAKLYTLYELVWQQNTYNKTGDKFLIRKVGLDPNFECDFCGCTELETHLGDECCSDCCQY